MRMQHGKHAATKRHRFGGLLWQRNFRFLWTGETVSQFGNMTAVVALPLLVIYVLHGSTFLVTALSAAAYLPWVLVGLPAGVWVDRMDCRRLMMGCDCTAAVLYGSLPAAAWLGILTIGQVLAVAVLAGSANVLFDTAYQVYLPSVVTKDQLVEGNAKLQASSSAASIGGPGIAGLLAGALGTALALLLNAVSFLVSAVCLLAIPASPVQRAPATPRKKLRLEVADGVRVVAHDPYLRPLTIWAALVNLALTGYSSLAVVFLSRSVGLTPIAVGVLLAASGLGGVAGALVTRPLARRFGTARALQLTAFIGMPFVLLIPLTGGGWRLLFFPSGALMTFSSVVAGAVILSSFRQTYTPPHLLGRVIATMRFLLYGINPVGALIAGGCATWLGIRNALWIMTGTAVLSGVCLLSRTFRGIRDLPVSVMDQPAERQLVG
jgi:MFS family permease